MGLLYRSARRLLVVGAGAFIARTTAAIITGSPAAQQLERKNHQGEIVSLKEGPAAAVGASVASAMGASRPTHAVAALTAGLGAGAVGLYDDMVDNTDPRHNSKGLKGHLGALSQGRITSGTIKMAGIGLSSLAAASLIDASNRGGSRRRGVGVANTLLGAGVIAAAANVMNLFDLRPGRALKVTVAATSPLSNGRDTAGAVALGTGGAASALFRDDLDEATMLGDCGANALGALVGLSMAARSGPLMRAAILSGLTALTLTSEKVSFTKVIANHRVLRELDELGRKPRQ